MKPQLRAVEKELLLRNARLAALRHVTRRLTSTLEIGDVLECGVEMAQVLSESAHPQIFLDYHVNDDLTLAASHWPSDQRVIPLQPRRDGITHTLACSGKGVR